MALFPSGSIGLKWRYLRDARGALAFVLPVFALVAGAFLTNLATIHLASAANNSVQGVKKDEGGLDLDAPTAILIEASS
ncbi:MAG TPA: hypothetical protein VGC26_01325, partial [Afipia sp.]